MCIFSTPKLFAGIKEIYPEEFEALKRDEEILGFTLDNKCDLETFVGDAESCVYHGDFEALRSLITGEFTIDLCLQETTASYRLYRRAKDETVHIEQKNIQGR